MNKSLVVVLVLILTTLVPRLASLGTFLTVDEPLWQNRGQSFLGALSTGNFDKTILGGQPGITTNWLVGLSNPLGLLAAHQASIALATGGLILLITYFLTLLWGWRWGMVGGFFLALDPFLLGHSRIVHTDALFALFYLTSLVSLLAGLAPLRESAPLIKRYLVISAIAGGLAFLSKIFAMVLLPSVFVILLSFWLRRPTMRGELFRLAALWIGVFVVTIYALWPALWLHADAVIAFLRKYAGIHSEGTRSLETTSRWWYYARETFFRFTPLSTLLLIPGIWGLTRRRNRMQWSLAWLLLAGVFFALVLSFSGDKSDRYILITHLVLMLLSVFGLKVFIDWIKKTQTTSERSRPNSDALGARVGRQNLGRLKASIIIIALLYLAIDAARLHPYYLAHYNRLYPIEKTHKLGWGEGLEEAARYIQEQHPNAKVASYYHRVFDYFYDGPSEELSGDTNADYLVLYRSMFERGPDHPDTQPL